LRIFCPSQEAAYIPSGEGSGPNVVRMFTSFERLKLNTYPQALVVGERMQEYIF
jgi:hypothetical protein